MKAVAYSEYGGPDVLRHIDLEIPTPKDDEILVRVRAAALNPVDWHFMRGMPFPLRLAVGGFRKPKPNRIVAIDCSGTVEAVGRSVTELAVGDAVFGGQRGTLAEYVSMPVKDAVRKPANVTFEQAGGVFLAGLTALQAMRDIAKVQRGQQVLINGASGGIGTFAVQIAKALGAHVTGVASTRNQELVRSLGADEVIDYTTDDFTASGVQYDFILDNVSNHSLSELRRALTPTGMLVPNGGNFGNRWFAGGGRVMRAVILSQFVGQTLRTFIQGNELENLVILKELIEAGKVSPIVDTVYPLSEARRALDHVGAGHARGKVVISVAAQPAEAAIAAAA
jgi:NADPH:quinone reductase-like Zn-dependent oxidoreductase